MPKFEGAMPAPCQPALAERTAQPGFPPVAGLGPHGERPASPERIVLSERDVEHARHRRFRIAILLHTTESDWAKQQIAGIGAVLEEHGAVVTEVIDCAFSVDRQIETLERLAREPVNAVISIPFGNSALLAKAYRTVSAAGIKLILLDNAPVGLLPERDYVSVVSADNFGLGEIAAALLSPHVRLGGKIGLVAYRLGFFATTQREISFRRWFERERPDIIIRHVKFEHMEHIESLVAGFLDANTDTAGMFAVWDGPALRTMRAIESCARTIPMTTVDLGREVTLALTERRIVKGIGAQRPFDQGSACAKAILSALVGNKVPSWVVLPGLSVTCANVVDAFQAIWHAPAPAGLMPSGPDREASSPSFEQTPS